MIRAAWVLPVVLLAGCSSEPPAPQGKWGDLIRTLAPLHTPLGEPKRLLTRAGAGSGEAAGRVTRVPPGHPEGYLEGFATIYSEAAQAIKARRAGADAPADVVYPTVQDGLDGVAFVAACVASSKRGGVWVNV